MHQNFYVRSLNTVPNKSIGILLILLNSSKLWWDFRKPFHKLTAVAWEFLPKTIKLTNPWPCVIIAAKDAVGWFFELGVSEKVLICLICSWYFFLWERLVIPLEVESFSSAGNCTAVSEAPLSTRRTSGFPDISIAVESLSSLENKSQPKTSVWSQPGSSDHDLSLLQNALFLLGISHFRSKLCPSLQPSALQLQEAAAIPGSCSSSRGHSLWDFADGWFSRWGGTLSCKSLLSPGK